MTEYQADQDFATFFSSCGANLVPANVDGKTPAVKWGEYGKPDSPKLAAEDYAEWRQIFPNRNGLLLLGSCALAVIDIDEDLPELIDWVVETFGDTPLRVRTGRGWHFYYRDPTNTVRSCHRVVGPDEHRDEKGLSRVDIKGRDGYVVAPGSMHENGTTYEPVGPMPSPELLPEIDLDALDAARTHGVSRLTGDGWAMGETFRHSGYLPKSTEVITAEGATAKLGELPHGRKFHSPSREDNHASCAVYEGRVYDYTTRQVWSLGTEPVSIFSRIIAQNNGDSLSTKEKLLLPSAGTRACEIAAALERAYGDRLDHRPLAFDEPATFEGVQDARTTYLYLGPMACGKTADAVAAVALADTALVVAHTISLTTSAARDRYQIPDYTDADALGGAKLATTLASIEKVPLDPRESWHAHGHTRDLVVVDEVDAVREFLHSGKLRHASRVREHWMLAMATARVSVAMSADLNLDEALWLIEGILAVDPTHRFVFVSKEPQQEQRTVEVMPLATAEQEFYDAAKAHKPGDLPLFVAITSTKQPQVIRRTVKQLAKINPGLRVLALSRTNSREPEVKELLASPNRLVEEFDVIIASPVLQSGFHITAPVGRVFVLHSADHITAKLTCQMSMRCRNVAHPVITYGFVPKTPARDLPVGAEELEAIALGLAEDTDNICHSELHRFALDYTKRKPQAQDDHLLKSWVMTTQHRNKARNDKWGDIRRTLAWHGWKLVDRMTETPDELAATSPVYAADLEAARTAKREAKAELKAERHADIAAADVLTQAAAKKIEDSNSCTFKQMLQLERHRLSEFYEREVTPELVAADQDAKTRKRCRLFVHMLAYEETIPNGRRYLAGLDARANEGQHATEYEHNYQQAKVLQRVVEAVLGCTIAELEAMPRRGTAMDIAARVDCLARDEAWSRVLFEVLGTTIGDNRTAWFAYLCRRVGITRKEDGQCKVKGRTYVYSCAEVAHLASAYRSRVRESTTVTPFFGIGASA